jgi:hypothetical protein
MMIASAPIRIKAHRPTTTGGAMTFKHVLFASTAVVALLIAPSFAPAAETVDTRIGKLTFESGYP